MNPLSSPIRWFFGPVAIGACVCLLFAKVVVAIERPNLVLILADDLGYGDLTCFGGQGRSTPRLDRLAREGTRFTDFYVSQAVCSASRASLMSGCYANRIGMAGALNHTSREGISDAEWLLPEMLQQQGYATAAFGKWHLGLPPAFNPLRHGFHEFKGLPYSNDNSKYHPVLAAEMPPLPWFVQDDVVETDPDQTLFTRRLTDAAVDFIERNQERPFFLYLPHVMPHVPIFTSSEFRGRTQQGLYADVINELDSGVGEVLDALDRLKLTDHTWVIFASDNGPFISYGDHAGSAAPLREGKLTAFEGGVRVPCLMRWPNRIPENRTCSAPLMTIDLLPTIASIVGGKLPTLPIDGIDRKSQIRGEREDEGNRILAFYSGTELHAVRQGPWKLHLEHDYLTVLAEPGRGGKPSGWGTLKPQSIEQSGVSGIASRHGYRVAREPLSLYDLSNDPGETTNVVAQHPEVVARLQQAAATFRRDLGDSLVGIKGTGTRAAGLRETK